MTPIRKPISTDVKRVRVRKGWRLLLSACAAICVVGLLALKGWAWYRVRHTAEPVLWPVARISPTFLKATVAMEDGYFYQHGAFDWQAIGHAAQVNLRRRRIVLGGSTLTQQLAKNIYLNQERTFGRKFLEVFLATELERQWGKNRILERYVNEIDYGMGKHGIEAAAQFYFHKNPDKLTLAESAVLVGLVPSAPTKWPANALIEVQRGKALDRIAFFFTDAYTPQEVEEARKAPLQTLLPGLPR
jgi:membrane peptidoglycan carboxypeptidase